MLHIGMPIRRWLILALALALLIPILVGGCFALWQQRPGFAGVGPEATLSADVARWGDPAWQATTGARLATEQDVRFLLVDASGREVFRSATDPFAAPGPDRRGLLVRRVVVDDDAGRALGTVYLYYSQAPSGLWLLPVTILGALAVVLAGVGWFVERAMARPLAATAAAARRVAEGDLAVALPGSPIREVAAVNAAFVGMSAALRDALGQQAQLEQERRLFIGAVAHDLRTPLFALRGYLEGLGNGVADTPAKTARYLASAQDKAATLERLIADLFDYTRLEYLNQTPRRDPIALGALLRRLVEGAQPQAEAKGVTLTLAGPESGGERASDTVAGDAHQLTRAIENLLDNALRHTPAGGRIAVAWRLEPGHAVFTVRDTGDGIALQDLPHIFTPLYRGEDSRNRRTGGAGLGLTTARQILLAHGGDLAASNAVAGGALFTGSLARTIPEPAHPAAITTPPEIERRDTDSR